MQAIEQALKLLLERLLANTGAEAEVKIHVTVRAGKSLDRRSAPVEPKKDGTG